MMGQPVSSVLAQQSPGARVLERWQRQAAVRAALVFLALLVLAGVLAPLISNEFPLLAKVEGAWTSPALQAFSRADIVWTVGGLFLLLMLAMWRLVLRRRPRLSLGLLLLGLAGTGSWAALVEPQNPAVKDWPALEASSDATFLWAPVPHGWMDMDQRRLGRNTPPLRRPDHPLGTDSMGRDVSARLLFGARVSLLVGVFTVLLSVLIGCLIGATAGYLGGRVDAILSWLIQVVMCFPVLFAVIVLQVFLPPGVIWVVLLLALVRWTGSARLMRAEVRRLKNEDFVSAARVQGLRTSRIIVKHLIPNALTPVLVNASFAIGAAILLESTLSFLGLGVPAGTPSWGQLLRQGQTAIQAAPHLVLLPGVAIFLTVLSFNVLGEGLRRALDPSSQTVAGLN